MALDTAHKRSSALGIGLASLRTLPPPSSGIDNPDRQHAAYCYSGISSGASTGGGGNVWLTGKQWALSPPKVPAKPKPKPKPARQGVHERLVLVEALPDCIVTLHVRDRSRWPVNERQVLRAVAPTFREVCTIKDRRRKPHKERKALMPSVPDAQGKVRVVGFVDERRELIDLVRLGLLPPECLP